MQSALQRERSRQWFEGTLLKAGDKRTNIVNLATGCTATRWRWCWIARPAGPRAVFEPSTLARRHDVVARVGSDLLRRCPRRQRRRGPPFFDEHHAAMEAGAELLWPDEEDLYTLMRMRRGRRRFEREKQGQPLNPEMCEWPEEYFDNAIWFDEWPAHFQVKTVALDSSKGSEPRRGDYSPLVMLGSPAQACCTSKPIWRGGRRRRWCRRASRFAAISGRKR